MNPLFVAAAARCSHVSYRRSIQRTKAIGIEIEDARGAYEQCTSHGGVGIQPPTFVEDSDGRGGVTISEIRAYGDVVLRFISFGSGRADEQGEKEKGHGATAEVRVVDQEEKKSFSGAFLPNFQDMEISGKAAARGDFGLQRPDHIVGNVWDLLESVRGYELISARQVV